MCLEQLLEEGHPADSHRSRDWHWVDRRTYVSRCSVEECHLTERTSVRGKNKNKNKNLEEAVPRGEENGERSWADTRWNKRGRSECFWKGYTRAHTHATLTHTHTLTHHTTPLSMRWCVGKVFTLSVVATGAAVIGSGQPCRGGAQRGPRFKAIIVCWQTQKWVGR